MRKSQIVVVTLTSALVLGCNRSPAPSIGSRYNGPVYPVSGTPTPTPSGSYSGGGGGGGGSTYFSSGSSASRSGTSGSYSGSSHGSVSRGGFGSHGSSAS